MEIRANHLLIGSIVLLSFIAILGFIIWVVKLDINREFSQYDIVFDESVAGLSNAAEVRYNGINVGKVKNIMIDPHHPDKVRVTISIDSQTPITDQSIASLEFQGFTGVAFVLIEGGTDTGKPLKIKPGHTRPEISSKASSLQELFTDVPTLITEVSVTLSHVRMLLSDENLTLVNGILKNINTVSGGLADRTERLQSIADNLDTSLKTFNTTMTKYQTLADTTNDVVDKDVRGLVTDLRATTASVHHLSDQLNNIVEANSGPITAFTSNTLPEVSQLVSEVRELANTLQRVSEQLENNPSEFLFGGKQPEYQPK